MAHTRKRLRKLSTAVFRGSKSVYSFDVFPISTDITDHAVVFIFSRRQLDKSGRWHHVVSCVGETQSIVTEIRKHKRARCVKGANANVVCVLKEPDNGVRSSVLDDIAAARTFSCVRGTIKIDIKAKPNAKKRALAKVLTFKPTKPVSKTRVTPASSATRRSDDKRCTAKAGEPTTKISKRKSTSVKPKNAKPAADRKRVQSGEGSDGGQHRPSTGKRADTRRTKKGTVGVTRSRTKLAA